MNKLTGCNNCKWGMTVIMDTYSCGDEVVEGPAGEDFCNCWRGRLRALFSKLSDAFSGAFYAVRGTFRERRGVCPLCGKPADKKFDDFSELHDFSKAHAYPMLYVHATRGKLYIHEPRQSAEGQAPAARRR